MCNVGRREKGKERGKKLWKERRVMGEGQKISRESVCITSPCERVFVISRVSVVR
jgi:hypothetical protein